MSGYLLGQTGLHGLSEFVLDARHTYIHIYDVSTSIYPIGHVDIVHSMSCPCDKSQILCHEVVHLHEIFSGACLPNE